jgi:hypothetical protein
VSGDSSEKIQNALIILTQTILRRENKRLHVAVLAILGPRNRRISAMPRAWTLKPFPPGRTKS